MIMQEQKRVICFMSFFFFLVSFIRLFIWLSFIDVERRKNKWVPWKNSFSPFDTVPHSGNKPKNIYICIVAEHERDEMKCNLNVIDHNLWHEGECILQMLKATEDLQWIQQFRYEYVDLFVVWSNTNEIWEKRREGKEKIH